MKIAQSFLIVKNYICKFIYLTFIDFIFRQLQIQIIRTSNFMSFSSHFQPFKQSARVILSDRFMGDAGAKQLAIFLAEHKRVEYLEIKSNDITSDGFVELFPAIRKNPNIKQIILQYNKMGENQYSSWQDELEYVLRQCTKLERLNISNNQIQGSGFERLIPAFAENKSLKLLQLRYNHLNDTAIQNFLDQLKKHKNQTLLFVQLSGNKIKREVLDALEKYLKGNRKKNPISKDRLLMAGTGYTGPDNTMNRTNPLQDIPANLSKDNIIRQLEDILDKNRRQTAEMKARLQRQLQDLQKRQKIDSKQLADLDQKCNELIIQNRNLKFEIDRTTSQHQQIERDQQYQMRMHQQKIREANKQLMDLQNKFEDIQSRMNKDHELKVKEIAREWQNKLRAVEDKIRMTENQNNILDNEIRKTLEKRQRLKIQYLDEENMIRARVEDEENQRYSFKLAALQSKLRQIEQSRQAFIRRNQQLLHEIDKTEATNSKSLLDLQQQHESLKLKQQQFIQKNKDFITRNEKIKAEIKLKQITVEKLQEEINRLNNEIQMKKHYNREQIQKIVTDSQQDRIKGQEEKQIQINKLNQLQTALRTAQLENARLRQQYALLAQKLQMGLGKAVQQVFTQNNLY